MYARFSEFRVPPEKLQGFVRASKSLIPLLRKETGFRSVLVLRGDGSPILVRVVTVWDSLEDLKASEDTMFLARALARVAEFSKGFPWIEECDVLVSDFPVPVSAKHSLATR